MALKTYWHLSQQRRVPTEYELVSSRLLYYPAIGPEVRTPLSDWVIGQQARSVAAAIDWSLFSDPRQTTYRAYVELQNKREIHVRALLDDMEREPDSENAEESRRMCEEVIGPLRYPCHGMLMLAAYVGHLAPEGKLTICCAFQTGDEIRRIERFAACLVKAAEKEADFAERAKARWREHPAWQPLRRVIEEMLVPDDWFKRMVSLNLVLRPLFDGIILASLAGDAHRRGRDALARVIASLREDGRWHREWTAAAVKVALLQDAALGASVRSVVEFWLPKVREAAYAVIGLLSRREGDHREESSAEKDLEEYERGFKSLGIDVSEFLAGGIN